MPLRRAAPSPVVPVLLVGTMLLFGCIALGSTYLRIVSYNASMPRRMPAFQNSPSSVGLGAIIPLVLVVLLVEAFGMPQHRHGTSPLFALVESVAQNLSFPLFISMVLLMLTSGLIVGLNRPWQASSVYSSQSCFFRGNKRYCST